MKGTLGVAEDGGRHDVTGDTASTAEISLLRHVDVDDVLNEEKSVLDQRSVWECLIITYLVFAKEGKMEDDFQGLGIGSEDNEIGEATVESLGGLIGTLLDLYHLTIGD